MTAGVLVRFLLATVALLLSVGCSSSEPTGALTAAVKGKVTFKGQPVTKGTVAFEPDGGGKEAFGTIQPDGTFIMTTYKKEDGAVLGKHRVSVSNAGISVPLKYASYSASKVEVEVTAEKTEYPIELH